MDIERNLWITVHTKDALRCINPTGENIHVIDLPEENRPTNLSFGDRDMKTAYVTCQEANNKTIAPSGQRGV